ncbi:Hsp70 family protein [Psychroserpens sp. NJDZ02]|uniref:Hsp70 family protein n=1 Tax=Psychroserpens sp. NJDZ02 TaxID=2570561 RepID=UPI0010A94B4B|nr:Hsp70 family protein [Psychroserpens sp. NJDZ02]QCE41993.1 Hsp70 family protein [Psychroserpens sp. NJDZ02]
MKTINIAIDLGTTNSLIAHYNNGAVKIYNNPLGLKQTLPSCVAFRGSRTIIGDKALDYLEKDAENVCMLFKRKMGTQETYFIPSIDREVSPIELSSLILKELKNFVSDGDQLNAAVITIPASFDTIQSNATKKAGYLAGFKEVVLLQEPIAACLAFANQSNLDIESSKNWIVYDFGGGTFDVALVEVNDRELKVIDNEGDNFLGGADFDNLIVEKIIIPQIEAKANITNLWKDIKAKSSQYKGLYFELLKKAEEAKKELSVYPETEIEIDIDFEDTNLFDQIVITRGQFEAVISSKVEQTITFIKKVISQNQLINSQIERLILIGGSTYVPLIKERIKEETGILVDSSIDPTSAVVDGAAYFAGSKPSSVEETDVAEKADISPIDTQIFYEQNTRDLEELITCKVDGDNLKYRITRADGGYDSGIKTIENNGFYEFVPLLKGQLNRFKLHILDFDLNPLKSINTVAINQGSYNVLGQPLPIDICMEIDDIEASATRLEQIFRKGSILPLKKKIYKTASKTILKGADANLIINIVEGQSKGLPSSGLSIGYIEFTGKDLEEDLIKGTDIEIELEITESRDLKINVYLQACDQEFKNVFSESERTISIGKINMEINAVLSDVEHLIREQVADENFEYSSKLEQLRIGLIEIQIETTLLDEDDVSDKKYQLDDIKRKLIQEFDSLTRNKVIALEIEEYNNSKESVEWEVNKEENESYRPKYLKIITNEKEVINSGDKYLIRAKIKELDVFYSSIIQSSDENFIGYYLGIKYSSEFKDTRKAKKLIKDGDEALERNDYKSIKHIVYALYALLPDTEKAKQKEFKDDSKTGLR